MTDADNILISTLNRVKHSIKRKLTLKFTISIITMDESIGYLDEAFKKSNNDYHKVIEYYLNIYIESLETIFFVGY